MITFRTDNVLDPFQIVGQFDLIMCRNLLFYFQPDQRLKACAQIVQKARSGAALVVGAGEMLPDGTGFTACRDMRCVYTKG